MRLLTVECGSSKLPAAITAVADRLHPKADMISTMNLNLNRLNFAEFKYMLYHLAPDTIILNPPTTSVDKGNWDHVVEEVIRHTEVTSGRILFVSSVEVLGDALQRTEDSIEMPFSELGTFLYQTERLVAEGTARHYIIRLPYTVESAWILAILDGLTQRDQLINLISLEDAAKMIVARIQTGLYGKYHVTPNDGMLTRELVPTYQVADRIADLTLKSKYTWQSIASSKSVWKALLAGRKS